MMEIEKIGIGFKICDSYYNKFRIMRGDIVEVYFTMNSVLFTSRYINCDMIEYLNKL